VLTRACSPCLQEEAKKENKKNKKEEPAELKRVARPDDDALKAKIAVEDDKIAAKQRRLEEIKRTLDQREGRSNDNSELAAAKSKFAEVRSKSRQLLAVRRHRTATATPLHRCRRRRVRSRRHRLHRRSGRSRAGEAQHLRPDQRGRRAEEAAAGPDRPPQVGASVLLGR
jgi:chromosome segregation ATPase